MGMVSVAQLDSSPGNVSAVIQRHSCSSRSFRSTNLQPMGTETCWQGQFQSDISLIDTIGLVIQTPPFESQYDQSWAELSLIVA